MASRIQIRRDTAANWSANNPTLASGEIAFVTDENKVKIGDGGTAWNSLAYLEADAYLDSVVMGDDTTGNYVETLIASDGISISGEGQESASVTVTNTGVLSLAGTTNEIEVSAASGNITLSLPTSITVDVVGDVTGNADTASALAAPRNISLGGDVSGSASFDGSADITITATVADDSHNHTIANVDGLQTALDNNASSASTVASDLTDHENATTNVHGIADTSLLATKDYADNSASAAAAALVDSAPETLNTLNELAAALGDDANFSTTITDSIATKLSITSASATYLTQADAATTYDAIGSASAVASDLTDHENATTNVHGIADTSALATKTYADNAGVTSLTGTASEIDVSASSGAVTLSLPTTINANTTGSAASLTTARTISLGGDLSGSASFNGTSNITITAAVSDDSHNHVISNVDGLQDALDDKLDSTSYTASDVLTKIKTVDGASSGLDSDLLDGQHGSHYLDWTNTTNKPDPTITLAGDLSGSVTLTNLGNGTLTATVADDSHNHIISNVDGLQTALDGKAPLESPALTGTPTAPTASASVNSTQIATTAFVQTAVSNLIDGAPGALDTLNELAASLGDDSDFAGTVTNSLAGKQPLDADLTAIAGLAGTSGLLKKDSENTWSLDTNTYLTGNETITVSGDATGSGTTSISLTLANSGVSASTYGSSSQIPVLTVDSKGRITSASAASVEGLPSQTGNSGKYLTTNGTAASWDTINLGTDTAGNYVATIAGTANEIEVTGSGSESAAVTLSLPATINANTTGSAASLTTARTISLGGDVSGSASFDGTSNATITAVVADDSHNHVISNVDGLQTALNAKAPLASPALTGTPTAPTASAATNTTQIATTAFVQTAVSNLVDSAPATLDTLNELAAALNDDPNFATTVTNSIAGKQPLDADLTAIAALAGTSGFLKKTAANTWSLDTNSYLTGNQTITLTGDATGSGTTSITVTVADDSHNHIISNVDGLQSALDAKLDSTSYTASDVLTKIKTVDGASSGLDADLLDGQQGSYYLDWTNVTNKPDPTITLGGDASGSVTLTNLGNGTLTVTVADDSHNHVISNVDGLQTALDAKLNSSSYTAADVLTKIKTVDGAGSGLDADLLDGQSSAYYRNVANFNAGTLAIARGGTNTTATPTGGGIAYGTGSAIAYTAAGTTGQVLTSNGTSAPTWQAAAASGFNGFFLAGM